jgi:ABC-type uncharacterized transport system permease subunit
MVGIHLACSVLSYAAFLAACVAAMLFLVQERQLKRKHMGWWFHRLPPLERLEQLNLWAIGLGFGLLSLGVACGFIGSQAVHGRWWTGDPMEYMALGAWTAYLALWLVRLRATLRGRRVALLSVLGFGLALSVFFGVRWWSPTWHS